MSVETYIRAMPKVELRVRLEGAFRKQTLQVIAEQNDIPPTTKNYSQFLNMIDRPDYNRLDDLSQTYSQWLREAEDITRLVYDAGVALVKQNVRYAEIYVHPIYHMPQGMSLDGLLEALNDGRDRVLRGWGVRLSWVILLPRDEPRRADEVVRWASSATGKKGHVVGFALVGRDNAPPNEQIDRAFATAFKKDVPRFAFAGEPRGAEGVLEVLNQYMPTRILDGWGAADAPDVLSLLSDRQTIVDVCMSRALCHGWTKSYVDYPLRRLYDENVNLTLSSDMPTFYKSSLSDEYLAAVEHCGLTIAELEAIALNAVRGSLLPEAEKNALLAEFTAEYARLREEHLESQTM
jgi:adenosine deaminase